MKNRIITFLLFGAAFLHAADSVSGNWRMSFESPHGPLEAALTFKQDGAKLTGTLDTQMLGTLPLTGAVDGNKISFDVRAEEHHMSLTFTGSIDKDKMSGTWKPAGRPWSATRATDAAAQPPPKAILGAVTEFKPSSMQMGVQPDQGQPVLVKFGPDTDIVQIRPGERDLKNAAPAKITDIALGDRVLVSFVEGMDEARRIVVISATDIAKRNEAVTLDWQRGVSGIVKARTAEEITLQTGQQTATVAVTAHTAFRRYAPDSVKFVDAFPSTIDEISPGDQLRARGQKSPDGLKFQAEEIVFGTFLTRMGTITAVNAEAGRITIADAATKKPLTVKLSADSKLKTLPDMRAMFARMQSGNAHGPDPELRSLDAAHAIDRLPACTIADLKPGAGVIVSSTRGATPDQVTAILLLANADMIVHMVESRASGGQGMSEFEKMHAQAMGNMHGMLGPSGLTLPGMLP